MKGIIQGLVPMAHVADVQRSVDFYQLLGFEKVSDFVHSGIMRWAHLQSGKADLFVALASDPVSAGLQGVLFYLYSPDLVGLSDHLLGNGVQVSAISYPFYMEKGEARVDDPDGYCLLIGQSA